ncbi:MAG: DUF1173 family protein [Burkholderiaceae bacterium]|nr:DUF1173 family protein [Burkholderiaceae bacterium]
MDTQRLSIRGRILEPDDPALQEALAAVYETPERPRCLCVPGGVEMYVAFHRSYLAKRMPDTGSQHHPACPSFEPSPQQSGLGELVGDAVVEAEGAIELRVDFAWNRQVRGRAPGLRSDDDPGEVEAPRRRMSLRALTHFLFERAGFNRWSPAMAGKRSQGVLHKYLQRAAEHVRAKGVVLAERLYVPEQFNEATHAEAAQRRRERLGVLRPHDGVAPLAMALAEFKAAEACPGGYRIWLKHMPDAPLLASAKTWERIARTYAAVLEARDADHGQRVRAVITALIRARREHTYEIDTATLLLASDQWIPVEGVHGAAATVTTRVCSLSARPRPGFAGLTCVRAGRTASACSTDWCSAAVNLRSTRRCPRPWPKCVRQAWPRHCTRLACRPRT